MVQTGGDPCAYMLPPANTPALPRPETALPKMKTNDDPAPALMAQPMANIQKEVSQIAFIGKTV